MGYARLGQFGCGLQLRQFSRAYVIDDGTERVLFVTVDSQAMSHGIRNQVNFIQLKLNKHKLT